jgi:hypothetical protein
LAVTDAQAGNVVDLNARRAPVTYTLTISHHWDETLEVWVEGVTDSERSQESIWYALKRFIDSKFEKGFGRD